MDEIYNRDLDTQSSDNSSAVTSSQNKVQTFHVSPSSSLDAEEDSSEQQGLKQKKSDHFKKLEHFEVFRDSENTPIFSINAAKSVICFEEIPPEKIYSVIQLYLQAKRIYPAITTVKDFSIPIKISNEKKLELNVVITNGNVQFKTVIVSHMWLWVAKLRFSRTINKALELISKNQTPLLFHEPDNSVFLTADPDLSEDEEQTQAVNKPTGVPALNLATQNLNLRASGGSLVSSSSISSPRLSSRASRAESVASPSPRLTTLRASENASANNSPRLETSTPRTKANKEAEPDNKIFIHSIFSYKLQDIDFEESRKKYVRLKIQHLKNHGRGNSYQHLTDPEGQKISPKNLIVDLEKYLDNVGWLAKRFGKSGAKYKELKNELDTLQKNWVKKQLEKQSIKVALTDKKLSKENWKQTDYVALFRSAKERKAYLEKEFHLSWSQKRKYLSMFEKTYAQTDKTDNAIIVAHNLAITHVRRAASAA